MAKKNERQQAKKNEARNSGKTKVFRLGPPAKKTKLQENLRFPQNLQNPWKNKGFRLAEPAARKGDPRRLQARDEELQWNVNENVGTPYVS